MPWLLVSDGWVDKTVLHKKWCYVRICIQVLSAARFSVKPVFLESVSFHLEMLDVTNFRLVLVVLMSIW